MRYYEDIILDKSIKDIKSFVKRGFSAIDYYAVCFCEKNSNLMEIISINNILKDCYSDFDYGVIGIVKGRAAARNLAAGLVESWLKTHDDLNDFKEYYNGRCR